MKTSHHIPVLLDTTIALLAPGKNESYLDLTAGYGGHATAVINATKAKTKAVLVDRDPNAVKALHELFSGSSPTIIHDSYENVVNNSLEEGKRFDMVLMDLGVSSPQFDRPERGFSFRDDGPLDMRMDTSQGQTAQELIQSLSQDQLAQLLKRYGEEPHAKAIAKAIVEHKQSLSTLTLANLIAETIKKRGKIHPATRTFQALRIAVNDELGQLERTLPKLVDLLQPGGRLVIISFHSLEDRLVKQMLQREARSGYESRIRLLTKKPIMGSIEDVNNPRARSAKLRAAVKIKKEEK